VSGQVVSWVVAGTALEIHRSSSSVVLSEPSSLPSAVAQQTPTAKY